MKHKELHNVTKFLTHELELKEQIELDNWLKENKNQEEFKKITIVNHLADLATTTHDGETAFEIFSTTIGTVPEEKKGLFFYLKTYYQYAAILLLVISITSLYIFKHNLTSNNITNIMVPNGAKLNIELPDGTKVILNAASKLEYNKDFLENRIVKLNGQAYFEVPKMDGKSFVVELDDQTKIKVLGTSFDVKAYKDDARLEATLLEGRIELLSSIPKRESVILEPNTTVFIDKINNSMELLIDDDVNKALSWQKEMFYFKNEYLSDIVHELGRFYDVEIQIKNPQLKYKYFTASFEKGAKLKEVLNALSVSGNFNVSKKDSSLFELSF